MSEGEPFEKFTEYICFDSSHETEYGTKVIDLCGQEEEIHNTNSLPFLFKAFVSFREGQPPKGIVQQIYFAVLKDNKFNINALLENFVREHRDLYDELHRIYNKMEDEEAMQHHARGAIALGSQNDPAWQVPNAQPSRQELALREYYFSQMFDGLAEIATKFDPDYEIAHFCR
jgi:hypothetical protein